MKKVNLRILKKYFQYF